MNTNPDHTTDLYDYPLYKELVAQHPLPERDASRLMVLNRATGKREHRSFSDIVRYLRKGDALVLNDSKVIPARLIGSRKTGGAVKVLLVNRLGRGRWRILLETRGKPSAGEDVLFDGESLRGTLVERLSSREWVMVFESDDTVWEIINKVGRMPLPPYIKRHPGNDPFLLEDMERYQSVFASKPGSIAAPTAGLHFTPPLLGRIRRTGVEVVHITLHVGLGTFMPIRSSAITRHKMEKEYYELDIDAARRLNDVRKRGGRVVAVGSTCCRVLETLAQEDELKASKGWTDLFIHPPYRFKMVDALLTNFHLPRTTLLVLVAAFAGRTKILEAYAEAEKKGYRFYSYGDAMLIL
ncbi:MAG: tRNA preQ1(34) S-adenosylmethionine ribosyltransferase-isomerase QueA [Candidatus Brocadiales bacterium]|nr:tRNA preQ1(34) S-adenosylmethionine ribosyltransferase-isomerase QueA [Candidatus Bathyanammoxibius amoris]